MAPVWSPQGDKIAFGFGRFFQSLQGAAIGDIAVINKDGSHLKIITEKIVISEHLSAEQAEKLKVPIMYAAFVESK